MADEKVEFKYRAEYAKSGRSSCKGCKKSIEKDSLRLAILVQSSHFDGKVPHWYHHTCFFGKQKPSDAGDIEFFDSLKWDDQEKIKHKIIERASGGATATASGKKPSKRALKIASNNAVKDFLVEYAKSSRAMCQGCEIKIAKGEVRISKKDYESEDALRYGGKDLWHHVECFTKLRNELGYSESGENLPGFVILTKEDQETVKKSLPKVDSVKVKDEVDGEPDVKKVKKEEVNSEETKLLKKQTDLIYKYKEVLKNMKRPEHQELLEHNNQTDFSSPDARIDHLADCMAFGALLPCEVCKNGQYSFKSGVGYQCKGDLTEWTKCLKIETEPKRKAFKIPESFIEDYPKLKKYKCSVGDRKIVFREKSGSSAKKENATDAVDSGPKVERFAPLNTLSFYLIGRSKRGKEDLKRTIVKLGGTLCHSFTPESLTAVISNEAEVEKCSGKMEDVKIAGIHVVPESFVDEASKGGDIPDLITKLSIAPWGSNIQGRISAAKLKSATVRSGKSKSVYTKSVPTKQTVIVKEGLAVDPDSELDDVASVYVDKKEGPYSVSLAKTNIQQSQNSYYKMQILVTDHSSALKRKYHLFRSWGRLGTTIGGKDTKKCSNLEDAKKLFHHHFMEKTGNDFKDKDNFQKKPGLYNPVDIAYGDETDSLQLSLKSDVPCKLHSSVQKLVSMLFDINIMKKVMMEFELDLEKMPLGKLSRKQIQKAFSVLSELQQKDGDIKPAVVIDATNRFYTLVPHSFGMDNPPLLDNKDIIKSKVEMLESLMEMETAYNMLKETKSDGDANVHLIEKHYSKLNTHIEVISKDSEEYILIDTYVKNTHGETHTLYELEIEELYKIKRQGEEKRFKPFKKLHNRKLLWHGSRLTNFAGILSQGLRIAPPEAPVTGYMFGKGIYFADMVSKSANYCMTSRGNNTGLLLLCEVALGEMYERTQAEYVEKLPSGKHSTKGIGVTAPDPKGTVKLDDGLEVPVGKGTKMCDTGKTSLLYNEFIVYDPAQVKARYLLKTKFNYKY